MRDDLVRQIPEAERGVRAGVAAMILDEDPPLDDQVARKAGWTVEQLQRLRADLAGVNHERLAWVGGAPRLRPELRVAGDYAS